MGLAWVFPCIQPVPKRLYPEDFWGFVCPLLSLKFFMVKKVMNAKVDGRSARGRPRFGWMDRVKRALNDRKMDMREASEE